MGQKLSEWLKGYVTFHHSKKILDTISQMAKKIAVKAPNLPPAATCGLAHTSRPRPIRRLSLHHIRSRGISSGLEKESISYVTKLTWCSPVAMKSTSGGPSPAEFVTRQRAWAKEFHKYHLRKFGLDRQYLAPVSRKYSLIIITFCSRSSARAAQLV